MLTELYEYALRKNLAARPGFKPKRVKAYIELSKNGEFLGVSVREKSAPSVYAPDIGAATNGTRYCNPLIEKAKIPLGILEDPDKDRNIPTKREFFLSMLDDGAPYEPRFTALAKTLRDPDAVQAIRAALASEKCKPADPIGFVVDGVPLEQSTTYYPWWADFRTRFGSAEKEILPRCLVTGDLAPAMETVPKVSGLIGVGGHTAGDAFLCYDKTAFQSFGLKKSENAPVSEEAMTAVNAALQELIAKAAVLGGAKLVHWYSSDIPEEYDPIAFLQDPDDDGGEAAPQDGEDAEASAMRASHKLHSALNEGLRPEALSARYYIMPLSGANGRMMVRGWMEGSYESLYRNVTQWFDDLQLVNWNGKGLTKPPKLKGVCTRLLKPGGDPKKVWSRLDEELPNLSNRLLNAIITNAPLPDDIPVRTLRWIRSSILSSDDENAAVPFERETLAFQLLKAWLCRKQRMRGDAPIMPVENNETARDISYYCGRLMAVYAAIQRKAMPEVGTSVAERYYTSASTSPAFVIGKLSQLAQHHLDKLDPKLAVYYENKLSEIYRRIGGRTIPALMTMEQQTEFALGYYQQRAAMYAKSNFESNDTETEGGNHDGN